MTLAKIGIIANPAAGKDIRRLTSQASVFNTQEKAAIVRRCIAGARSICDCEFYYLADTHSIVASALGEADGIPVHRANEGSEADSTIAAERMQECGALVSLGGDGTNRAIVKGWRDPYLIPISTGTNNAFPSFVEGTFAGMAAAFVASKQIPPSECTRQCKVIRIEISNGQSDLALVDAVATADRFVGARAITEASSIQFALGTVADSAKMGISGVLGYVEEVKQSQDYALFVRFAQDAPYKFQAPLAPGQFASFTYRTSSRIAIGDSPLRIGGPLTLALDGERSLLVSANQHVELSIERKGPHLIDVDSVLRLAATRKLSFK